MKLSFISIAMSLLFIAPGQVLADEYGCKVLLCLADPKGPMTQDECKPPIRRLMLEQSKKPPEPFPSCPEGKPAEMRPGVRPYDACPVETTALPLDSRAVQLTREVFMRTTTVPTMPGLTIGNQPGQLPSGTLPPGVTVQVGIGEPDALPEGGKNKVCVAGQLGTFTVVEGTQDLPVISNIAVFERVVTIAPAFNPRVVDIFVDGKLLRSARY